MGKRLVLDLTRCDGCDYCTVSADEPHASDHGVCGLRERATLAVICRRCEAPSCVNACRFDALERHPDGILRRHNLRCVGCGCCVQACPFGTLTPDMVAFYDGGSEFRWGEGDEAPPCVAGCRKAGMTYREVEPDEEGVILLDDRLAVRAEPWEKREAGR